MARYLLTHSLLSAWLYALKDSPYEDATTERDPVAEFMTVLRREPTPTTMEMQHGIDFENLVTAIIYGEERVLWHRYNTKTKELLEVLNVPLPEHVWYEAAERVARRCAGGILQYKAEKPVEVDGTELLLYGRLDCLKAGEIIDIKFTGGYDAGKYFSSTQHPAYLELIPEAQRFTYIASNGRDVFQETYRRDEAPSIYPTISNFLAWLRAAGLLSVYQKYWSAL